MPHTRRSLRVTFGQPDRIRLMHEHLEACGLLQRCTPVEARLATVEELQLAHSAQHVERMLNLESREG